MSRGKYQNKRKPFPILPVVLIALLVVALTSGGAVAYLAKSADPVTNTFKMAPDPTLTVDADNIVTVGNIGYAVYVRAAVVPNWKYSDRIIAADPASFSIEPGDNWFYTDGFYYYKLPVQSGGTTSPIYTAIKTTSNPGGMLEVDIAVQAIQALGTTDDDNKAAVLDAWDIQPDAQTP